MEISSYLFKNGITSYPHYRKLGLLLYIIFLSILLLLTHNFPSYYVPYTLYTTLYFSTHFSLFKISYYFVLLISGYLYVTGVTLRFKRTNLLADKAGRTFGFFRFLFLGFFMFWIGPNATLSDKESDKEKKVVIPYNNLIYTLAFLIMLHFSYLDTGALKVITLNTKKMMRYSRKDWSLFTFIVIGVILIVIVEFYFLYQYGRFWIYLAIYFFLLIVLGTVAFSLRKTYILHVHHYMLGIIILPMTAIPNAYAGMVQGLCLGIYTEGCARWGLDPLFKKK